MERVPLSHTQRASWPLARGRAPRSAARQPHLPPPPGVRLPWPLARPPGSRQQPLAGCDVCPCECGRPASAAGDGARWGRHVEKSRCSFRVDRDRAIGEIMTVGDTGSVWSSGGGPRARMTAQERSGGLGPIGRRSFDFVLDAVNKCVHSDTCVCPTPPPTICRNSLYV